MPGAEAGGAMTGFGEWSAMVTLDVDAGDIDERLVDELLDALAHRGASVTTDDEGRLAVRLSVPAGSPIEAVGVAVADVMTAANVRAGLDAAVEAVEARAPAAIEQPEPGPASTVVGRAARGGPSSRVVSIGSRRLGEPAVEVLVDEPEPVQPEPELLDDELDEPELLDDLDDLDDLDEPELLDEDEPDDEQGEPEPARRPAGDPADLAELGVTPPTGFALADSQWVVARSWDTGGGTRWCCAGTGTRWSSRTSPSGFRRGRASSGSTSTGSACRPAGLDATAALGAGFCGAYDSSGPSGSTAQCRRPVVFAGLVAA